MNQRLTTQAGLLSTSRAVGEILNALVALIAVRKLSQVEYGTLRQVYLLATTLTATELGFKESLYFFIPAFPQYSGVFVRQTVIIIAAMQFIAGALIYGFRQPLAGFLNNELLTSYLGLVALYSGLSVLSRIWDVELVAEQRVMLAALAGGGFEVLKVFIMLVALIVSPDISSLLWALVAAAALKCASFVLYLSRRFRWFIDVGPILQGAPQFSYAMALWIPGLLNFGIAAQGPQYIVAHFFDPAQYAIYAVACFQVPFVAIVSNSIAELLLVRATELRRQGQQRELYELWINGCRKALLLYIGVVAALVSVAAPMISVLFTDRYRASAHLFAILSLALVFNGVFQDSFLRACSAMKTYALFYALRAILSIILAFVGMKLWGLSGIALATVAAVAIVNTLQILPIRTLLQVPASRVLPWRDISTMLVSAAGAGWIAHFCLLNTAPPVIELIVGLGVFCIVYLLLTLKLGLLSRTELAVIFEDIRHGLRRPSLTPQKIDVGS